MKLSKVFLGILTLFLSVSPAFSEIYVIDAEKNSVTHNNVGMNYFNEGYYYGAIQEFKIAISLNPNSQSTATYFDNLGRTYLAIGYPNLAEDSFINAIKLNPMNLSYRQHLANAYRRMGKGTVNKKISEYLGSKNPLDGVMVGLLYLEIGDKNSAIIKLDEFCTNQPNLILSEGVKAYLKTITPKKY